MYKAVCITGFGGPEVLSVMKKEGRRPGPSELRLRVLSCGVNPIDTKIREGTNFVCKLREGLPFPWGLGFDVAGVVLEAGADSGFRVGEEVLGIAGSPADPCGYAEEAVIPSAMCIRVPSSFDIYEAGALPTAGLTAVSIIKLLPKDAKRVLIAGGTGGVGHLLAQYLKHEGRYVALTCSQKNLEFAKTLGADAVYDYHEELPQDLVKSFDAVVDMPGGKSGIGLYRYVKDQGTLVTVPTITGDEVIAAAERGIKAVLVRAGKTPEAFSELERYAKAGIRPFVAAKVRLEEAAKAHELLRKAHLPGKIVLTA